MYEGAWKKEKKRTANFIGLFFLSFKRLSYKSLSQIVAY